MTDLTPVDRAPAPRDRELSAAVWDLIDEATPATTRR